MKTRLPRFRRAHTVAPMQLEERDCEIIRLVHRHRFLRSDHIGALIGGSHQQMLRRLQLLFHHGYLERPRVQIEYHENGGSKTIAYGLGKKGEQLLRRDMGITVNTVAKDLAVGRLFLAHALLVADVMVAIELACRKHSDVRLLYEDEFVLPLESQPFQWHVKVRSGEKLGVVPDRVFALEFPDHNGGRRQAYFFLEADRGTMPVMRRTLVQTSFFRKLLAYEATWSQDIHKHKLGINNFRVLTVTSSAMRVQSLITACSQLERGRGLFLFADTGILVGDPLSHLWQTGRAGETGGMLD